MCTNAHDPKILKSPTYGSLTSIPSFGVLTLLQLLVAIQLRMPHAVLIASGHRNYVSFYMLRNIVRVISMRLGSSRAAGRYDSDGYVVVASSTVPLFFMHSKNSSPTNSQPLSDRIHSTVFLSTNDIIYTFLLGVLHLINHLSPSFACFILMGYKP